MKSTLIVSLFIFSLLLSACASKDVSEERKASVYHNYIEQEALPELKQIFAFKFHSWRSLDNKHLIISTTPRQPYLITLRMSCYSLNFANRIAVNHRGSTLDAGFDSIYVPDLQKQECLIKKIYKLSKEQAQQLSLLKASGDESKESASL